MVETWLTRGTSEVLAEADLRLKIGIRILKPRISLSWIPPRLSLLARFCQGYREGFTILHTKHQTENNNRSSYCIIKDKVQLIFLSISSKYIPVYTGIALQNLGYIIHLKLIILYKVLFILFIVIINYSLDRRKRLLYLVFL